MAMSLLGCQWEFFAYQHQVGLRLMETVLRPPARTGANSAKAVEPTAQTGEEFRRLECQAAERIRQGLAPPKEIYETPYRDRIDWSKFPVWARPSDPELFEDCVHEG
jgi:hypothetical protein